MKNVIAILLATAFVTTCVSCDVGTNNEKNTSPLPSIDSRFLPNIQTQTNEPVSVDDNIKFYWKDRKTDTTTEEKITNYQRFFRMKFDTNVEGSVANSYFDLKKDELGLDKPFEFYYYGTVGEWDILTIPLEGKPWAVNYKGELTYRSMAKVILVKLFGGATVYVFDPELAVPFVSILDKDNSQTHHTNSPIKAADFNSDGTLEVAVLSTDLEGDRFLRWRIIRTHKDGFGGTYVVDLGSKAIEPILDVTSGKTLFLDYLGILQTEEKSNMPHILEMNSNLELVDVSYKYPQTLRSLVEASKVLRPGLDEPSTEYLYQEQIGNTWNSTIGLPNSVRNYLNGESGTSTDVRDQRNWIEDKVNNNREFNGNFAFQKTEEDYYLANETKRETREEELKNYHCSKYVKTDRHKIWEAVKYVYDKNGFVTKEDIEMICYNKAAEDTGNRWFIEELPEKESFKLDIEPGSYWPERHLGNFVEIDYSTYQTKHIGGMRNPETGFPEYVQQFLFAALPNIFYDGYRLPTEPINFNYIDFLLIPLTEDVWLVFVQGGGIESNYGRHYCAIRVNEEYGWIEQILDWQKSSSMGQYIVEGIYDVNLDGVPDIIMSWNGWAATHNSRNQTIWTYKNDTLYQLGIDIDGINHTGADGFFGGQVEFFYGCIDGYPLFGSYELGVNAFHRDIGTCEAAMRYSCLHMMQVRKGGEIYDVTYKYPSEEHLDYLKDFRNDEFKGMWFRTLTHLESLGLTRAAQELFLKLNDESDIEYQIVRDCQKIGKPFVVQTPEECPAGWEINHVYR